MPQLTGIPLEHALIGNKIVDNFFCDSDFDETVERLQQARRILAMINTHNEYSVAAAIDIIKYAENYTANVKVW